jgi:hypothetical protein
VHCRADGADNAALLVDKFEVFLNATLASKQNFLATIWFQNVHGALKALQLSGPIDSRLNWWYVC